RLAFESACHVLPILLGRQSKFLDAAIDDFGDAFCIPHIPPAASARVGVTRKRSPGWSVCDAGSSFRSRSSSTVRPNFLAIEYQVSPFRTAYDICDSAAPSSRARTGR